LFGRQMSRVRGHLTRPLLLLQALLLPQLQLLPQPQAALRLGLQLKMRQGHIRHRCTPTRSHQLPHKQHQYQHSTQLGLQQLALL
jgi:hypothetical protein